MIYGQSYDAHCGNYFANGRWHEPAEPTHFERCQGHDCDKIDGDVFLEGERLWTCSDCGDKFCMDHIGWDVCAPCALMRWSKGEI